MLGLWRKNAVQHLGLWDEILECGHIHVSQSYWAVLSCGTVCKAVGSDSIFWDLSQIKDTELYNVLLNLNLD